MDGYSRFGVKGSSEVSEGLTAIYNFEHGIGTNADLGEGGRHHYVGLTGGFGKVTIGNTWTASFNNIAAITDNTNFLGSSGVTGRTAGIKYSVSVENISIQADATMNQGGGWSQTPVTDPATKAKDAVAEDKNVDQTEFAVSMGLGENGKIAFAHISHDANLKTKKTTNFLAGQYTIGSMTAYLGLSQDKSSDSSLVGTETGDEDADDQNSDDLVYKAGTKRVSGTFAGIRGSVGDTGVSYVFQLRKLKTKTTHTGQAYMAASGDIAEVPGIQGGTAQTEMSSTPWVLALNRSLGGGASVHFEHSNPDDNSEKSQSILALMVSF